MKKLKKHMITTMLCIFVALPAIAQQTSWYERDKKTEDKAAKTAIKDNDVKKQFRQDFTDRINKAFKLMWESAEVDSLYDWSDVDARLDTLSQKQQELGELREKANNAEQQAQADLEFQEEFATEADITNYNNFKKDVEEEMTRLFIEPMSLELRGKWTEALLDKQMTEIDLVGRYFNNWDWNSQNLPDASMIEKFITFKDDMVTLKVMTEKNHEKIMKRIESLKSQNEAQQLKTAIIKYLAEKPFNKDTTDKYKNEYHGNDSHLHDALRQHETAYNEIMALVNDIKSRGLSYISKDQQSQILEKIDGFLKKYNEKDFPYYGKIREALNNFRNGINSEDILKPGKNTLKNTLDKITNKL